MAFLRAAETFPNHRTAIFEDMFVRGIFGWSLSPDVAQGASADSIGMRGFRRGCWQGHKWIGITRLFEPMALQKIPSVAGRVDGAFALPFRAPLLSADKSVDRLSPENPSAVTRWIPPEPALRDCSS